MAPQAPQRRSAAAPQDLLAGHAQPVQRIADRLRELVLEAVPEAEERVHLGWHGLGYRHPRAGYFGGIFPLEDRVKLGFEWGALLRDEDGLLQPGASGGKQVRYFVCTDAEAIPRPALTLLLLEVIALRSGRV